MTTILLARHGQASFGKENYDQLSELGCTQAQMLGLQYANTQRPIDAIFSGSLVRQQDSARHFWVNYQPSINNNSDLSVVPALDISQPDSYVLPIFDEFNHKDVFIKSNPAFTSQGAIAAEIAKSDTPDMRLAELFDQAMRRWHAGDNDQDYIESWSQFSDRAQQALEQLRAQIADLSHLGHDSTVLVFTSGGVIAAITAQLLQQGSQTAYQINRSLVNTGVTTLTLHKQGARLLSLNEYSHLFAANKDFMTWR